MRASAVSEIPWGRSDEFGDFMTVPKLGAIDLDDSAGIADERLRSGFYCACLPGTSGAQEQEVSNRPTDRGQPSEKSLISPDDLVDCFVLSNDEVTKFFLQILRLCSRSSQRTRRKTFVDSALRLSNSTLRDNHQGGERV